VRGARWQEIDVEGREWRVPAERMKMKVEHLVPLSSQAMAILKAAKNIRQLESELIFPNTIGSALSDNTMSKLMRDNAIAGTPHGFRASFKIWAAEHGVRDEVSESVLAHGDSDKVRRAYRRTSYVAERRELMQRWSNFVHLTDSASAALDDRVQPIVESLSPTFLGSPSQPESGSTTA
jgi:integrase